MENSTLGNSQTTGGHNNATDSLPTYEETLESAVRKKYTLKYPQLISRTVHAVDSESGELAAQKRVKGLLGTKLEFYKGTGGQLLWSCRRERQGFELVFTRQVASPLPPPPPPISLEAPPFGTPSNEEEEETIAEQLLPMADGFLRDQADNKPADDSREYIHRENDQPPPAYEESAPNATQEIRLTSPYPFPFRYDFEFPTPSSSSSVDGEERENLAQTKLRWLRNQEAKNPSAVTTNNPWTAFACVERPSGRLLAEVVHYSAGESSLGTLVIHGELDPDLHTFLIVSAIPVVEEYPVRHIEYIDRK
ncbi:hypothetical protein IW140_004994 [Coemansia sp. RSA 1813]|nr:hypothetical protein EV178_006138 [Coemansia sp. RSA 1646]KAJ1766295.1 hypothetical protein LPJ74_005957 [Coemansia sp. RSA 1843]KAJ2085522.1 hypothetical protein IW138_006272 [Coemansia sp. RSA 986]KAJ2212991.1 hypothetical protein EV179_004219 [Coemansia sp. RSA 487]KAJ2566306.1 hypothetical protein IW140_004994 [Coemansia sp. RSA 1813]